MSNLTAFEWRRVFIIPIMFGVHVSILFVKHYQTGHESALYMTVERDFCWPHQTKKKLFSLVYNV